MRVAVVAGPDPGHAFPAIALCLKFLAAGDEPTLLTGAQWLEAAREEGIDSVLLDGLDPIEGDDDADSGAKLHRRAARMAVLNVPTLEQLALDLVVSDVITSCGGMGAEMLGVPWVELNPHPLYRPSKGLPPLGSGLAPGVGVRGRLRDTVMRALTARSVRTGDEQRSATAPHRHAARPGGTAPGLACRGRRRRPVALRADENGARGSGGDGTGGGRRSFDGDDGHAGTCRVGARVVDTR
jgi:UDP:flavonoid glycosyltransferase YjiC (YdhE family)